MKLLRGISLLAVLACLAGAWGQSDPTRDFVATEKDAYLMLPADFVCGPTVQEAAWSQDGERVAVLRQFIDINPNAVLDMLMGTPADRQNVEPEMQLIEWNTVSKKATTVLRFKQSRGRIGELQWIAGSSELVVVGMFMGPEDTEMRDGVFILTPDGQVRPVAAPEPGLRTVVIAAPNKPLVAYVDDPTMYAAPDGKADNTRPPTPGSVRFFGTDGVLSPPIKFPDGIANFEWSRSSVPYVISYVRQPNRKFKHVYYLVDRSQGKLTESVEPPDGEPNDNKEPDPILKVSDVREKIGDPKLGLRAPTVVIAAVKGKDLEPALVTSDGNKGELAPGLKAVSYASQGAFMVRGLVKVPLEAYRKAKKAARIAMLVSNAKQVALGLIMYSNDYDDNMLSNQGNWQSAVMPYIMNQDIMDGFNYTFSGGLTTGVADPANTEMGYFDGPGGRAVAYMDGHVQWVPKP